MAEQDGDIERLERALNDAVAQLMAIDEVLTVVGQDASDLDSVLRTVVEVAQRLCHADVAEIHLIEGDAYVPAAEIGLTDEYRDFVEHHRIAIDRKTLIGRVGVDGRAQQIDDVLADPDYGRLDVQELGGFRSILGVPMRFGGEIIGVVSAWRTEVDPFDDRAAEVLTTFAAEAAIAIRNADLMRALEARQDELARKVEQLEALSAIGQVVSSSLDPDEVITTIVENAVELSGADGGSIFEYDELGGGFRIRAHFGTSDGVLAALTDLRVGLDDTLLGRAVVDKCTQQVADLEEGPLDPHLAALLEGGWRSIVAVPILREELVVGALTVRRLTPGRFSDETCDLLETFAGQSALAILNARLYRELERKGAELEVASKHKSEFLASMSHELRTPLNAVIGFSEVLLERLFGDLTERQEEYLRDIWESGRHLLELLNDILDLSKVEAGRMELDTTSVPVGPALEYAVAMVRERAVQRGIDVEVEIDDGVDTVSADELKFKQVVLNLLSNAAKFANQRIWVRATTDEGMLVVSVADDGPGVPPEDRERIFESFQQGGRGAPKEEGTGLGLTLSRRIVELHGGRIWVESEPGLGSTFIFTVPLAEAAHSEERSAYTDLDRPEAPVVAIVEDDRRSLELLSLYLADAGVEVVTAADGQEGLELVRRVRPAAVVLDIRLPELDGWDLLAVLKADPATAAIPIVVVSMLDERGKGFALGAAEYLVKPVGRDDLRAALGRVAALPGSERTVICVEDDARVVDLLRTTLEPEGWTVLRAATAEEVIELARSRRPAVVLLDLLLSGKDGFALAEALRADPVTADVPTILLTSNPMAQQDKDRLRGEVAYAVDRGDFDPATLVDLVRQAATRLAPTGEAR